MKKLLAALLAALMAFGLIACGDTATPVNEVANLSAQNGSSVAENDVNNLVFYNSNQVVHPNDVVDATNAHEDAEDVTNSPEDKSSPLLVWDGTEFDWATNRTISTTAGVTFTCSEGFLMYATSEVDGLFECCMPEPLGDDATCIITINGNGINTDETFTSAIFYGVNDEILYETSDFPTPSEMALPLSYEGQYIDYVVVQLDNFSCCFDTTCG